MVGFAIQQFQAAMPGKDPRSIPETVAIRSVNQKLGSGALESVRAPRLVTGIGPDARAVFRIPTGAFHDLSASYWMQFVDPNTDVYRTPVVNDAYERYYWCSPSTGFKFAKKADILAGGAEGAGVVPGIPRPATPVTLDVIAGTGGIDAEGDPTGVPTTRAYVVTFVGEFGEEGPPSPAAEATGRNDQDWRLRDIPQPVTDVGRSLVTTIRIYRTVTGLSGVTEFYRVVDIAVGTLIYVDRLSDAFVTGQGLLEASNYDAPPDMDGIALMPNGVFVGFLGSNLYFSENFRPHAWPAAYTLTVPHPIVGLAVFGTSCVVLTTGGPSVVTGNNGETMTLSNIETPMPCLSRASIVVAPDGVYWASVDGLAQWTPGGMGVITKDVIPRDEWRNAYNPSEVEGTLVDGVYTGLRLVSGQQEGFSFPGGGTVAAYAPPPTTDFKIRLHLDIWSGKAVAICNSALFEWFPSDTASLTYTWVTKEFQTPVPINIAAVYVSSVFEDGATVALDAYANDEVVFASFIPTNTPVRLPSGFRADVWRFELRGTVKVHKFLAGQTIADLKRA